MSTILSITIFAMNDRNDDHKVNLKHISKGLAHMLRPDYHHKRIILYQRLLQL